MIEFTGARFAERRLIRKVEKAVYAELGQTDIFEVDLAVTDGETVREFNRETRGVDSETDVLSFPCSPSRKRTFPTRRSTAEGWLSGAS